MAKRILKWTIKDLVTDCVDPMLENKFDCNLFLEGNTGIGKSLDSTTSLAQHNGNNVTSKTKQISKFKHGDWINTISWDFDNNKPIFSKSQIIVESENKELFEVKLANNKIINCSKYHKLFVKKDNKIVELRLKDIKEGDELVCLI